MRLKIDLGGCQDTHRLLDDQDRTLRFMHLIRQQIDSLASTHMDNIMVNARRQYNRTAKRMGLPDRTKEIESLGKDLQDRFAEVSDLQKLLSEATDPMGTGLLQYEDEDELMRELADLDCEDTTGAASSELETRADKAVLASEGPTLAVEKEEGTQEEKELVLLGEGDLVLS